MNADYQQQQQSEQQFENWSDFLIQANDTEKVSVTFDDLFTPLGQVRYPFLLDIEKINSVIYN